MKKRDFLQYFIDVENGKEVACEKMKKLARRILDERESSGNWWHYDAKIADDHISFIETFCRRPAGKPGPLNLEPFQLAKLATVYGFVDDDNLRRFNEVFELIGRKNAKTTIGAAMEVDHVVNPLEGEYAPRAYNVATTRDQSGLAYVDVLNMRDQSPTLTKYLNKVTGGLDNPYNHGLIRALSGRTKSKDGLDVSFGLLDEMAAWTDRDLYDLLIQGIGARDQPLLIEITTNNFVRGGIFDDQYAYASKWLNGKTSGEKSDRFLPLIFELDDRSEWEHEECWKKANPGLGTIKKLSFMRQEVSKAHDDPAYLPTVMVKDFNIPENQAVTWLNFEECINRETFDPADSCFKYGIGGIDAADTTDLFGACVLLQKKNDTRLYAIHMTWITEESLRQAEAEGRRNGTDDGVPYSAWISRGLMRVVEGNTIDKRVALEWFKELRDKYGIIVYMCGYDPWHMTDDSTRNAYSSYFGAKNFIVVRQGEYTFSDPMRELKARYKDKGLIDNNNPIAQWCRSNLVVRESDNGGIQPLKKNLNRHNRIDAFMAELDAFVVWRSNFDMYQTLLR